ncbi:c-type cytochrome [Rubrivirga sp. IMCC43871]|uniref:c-type cytochrome n=1 Tax=Rubrivirga sp. IMCC43871 TaxID=3391575 RepID=UPI0039901C8D
MRLVVPLALFAAIVLAAYAPTPAPTPAAAASPADTTWSWPSPAQNLQVLPADTPPEQLRDVMRGFTRALGVRCEFCHVGEPGTDFLEWDFASDAKPRKAVAREMMRMTWAINTETLPAIEGLRHPGGMRVTCWTCHRGETTPATARPEE